MEESLKWLIDARAAEKAARDRLDDAASTPIDAGEHVSGVLASIAKGEDRSSFSTWRDVRRMVRAVGGHLDPFGTRDDLWGPLDALAATSIPESATQDIDDFCEGLRRAMHELHAQPGPRE